MTRLGEGGGGQARHPEPVAVVASWLVGGYVDIGRNVVRGDGCGRWHVIVKAAPFVPDDDEQHVLPLRACRGRLEDAGGECLPYLVVLKFSFGGSDEFGRDQAYGGAPAGPPRGRRNPRRPGGVARPATGAPPPTPLPGLPPRGCAPACFVAVL